MVKARSAEVLWDTQKKSWVVRIQAGEEVVRRTPKDGKRDSDDATLRSIAVRTAQDDGYELAPENVVVKR